MNVFSLSFGKDSMATLILAAEMGIPIDRVKVRNEIARLKSENAELRARLEKE